MIDRIYYIIVYLFYAMRKLIFSLLMRMKKLSLTLFYLFCMCTCIIMPTMLCTLKFIFMFYEYFCPIKSANISK